MDSQNGNEIENSMDDLVKLSFFSDIGKAITSCYTLKDTLEAVMQQIGRIFAPTHWSLLLRSHQTGELTFAVVVGSGVKKLKGQKLKPGQGVAGWIAKKGVSVIVEDVKRDERFDSEMDQITDFTTKSIIGVPLKSKNRVFGVIELINKIDGSPFQPVELNLLQTIADYAAIAIEKAYYFRALLKMANIDHLTGLNNRRTFFRYLEKEIEKTRRSGNTFAILMLDVDDFKRVNDTFGHKVGDRLLKTLANILKETTRKADIACRYGGDEFMLLLPDSNKSDAEILRDRLEERLRKHNYSSKLQISVSYGLHEGVKDNIEDIIHLVDQDMYRDKSEKQEADIYEVEKNIEDMVWDEKDDYSEEKSR